jgi:hypothetical protein
MSETIEQTWEQELLARGQAHGQIREARSALRTLLEERLGSLPESVIQRLEAIDDLERLRQLFRRGLQGASLAELDLS